MDQMMKTRFFLDQRYLICMAKEEAGPSSRAILDRLGQMSGADIFAAGQIGDGAGEFQDAVEGAGGEVTLVPAALRRP